MQNVSQTLLSLRGKLKSDEHNDGQYTRNNARSPTANASPVAVVECVLQGACSRDGQSQPFHLVLGHLQLGLRVELHVLKGLPYQRRESEHNLLSSTINISTQILPQYRYMCKSRLGTHIRKVFPSRKTSR